MNLSLPNGKVLELSSPKIMGIINCTPDSFYPGSRSDGQRALEAALKAEANGAHILDFGGESTRPNSDPVSEEEELNRVLPVLEAFRRRSDLPVSIDTYKFRLAKEALDLGADIVNDITALGHAKEIAGLCAKKGAALILMHMQGRPKTMQDAPFYKAVCKEVHKFFKERIALARAQGMSPKSLLLDPGFCFGKRVADNIELLTHLKKASLPGHPIVVGLSRKSFIGAITGRKVEERLAGSIAAHMLALDRGASILRVHDVRETADLVGMYNAVKGLKK